MTTVTPRSALETLRPSTIYPLIRTKGTPRERGRQYGTQAAGRIANTLNAYARLFAAYTAATWQEACAYGRRYVDVVGDFDSSLIEEMRGIAEGAVVEFDDILAVNLRTEIMYGIGELRAAAECTAFAATPEATADDHTILGQNWDWHPAAFESCVILSIEQIDRPSIVTVVEAGLLSKMGMNSEGVGVATNAMVTEVDKGEPGIPYHVMLRAIQNCSSTAEAVTLVSETDRASSANYLIADASGAAVDLEAAPGGADRVFALNPVGGVIGHANCFLTPNLPVVDLTPIRRRMGITRQHTIDSVLNSSKGRISVDSMKVEMQDHTNHPFALCRHPLENLAPIDRSATVASVIMDLNDRDFWVADGQPCSHEYRRFTPEDLWTD